MSIGTEEKDQRIREVYSRYRDELCHYLARHYRLDPAEAEDVVQAVFTRVAETNIVLTLDNPRAFLYKMAANTCIDLKRRDKVRASYQTQVVESDEEREFDHTDPAREVEADQQLRCVTDALRTMPEKRRRMLLMNRLDGLSYAEIARREQLSETVVRKHIFKALADCQKALENQPKHN